MLAEISKWILSIAGIICTSVLIELVLPDGQINRYIKGILSFIIVLVIITPIPKLLNSEYDFSNIFNYENNIEVDEDYLYQLNLNKINVAKTKIEEDLTKRGYKNIEIYINADIFENQMKYKSINVDLTRLVISQNAEHNDIAKIKKDISKIIKSYIDIGEEEIYYEN